MQAPMQTPNAGTDAVTDADNKGPDVDTNAGTDAVTDADKKGPDAGTNASTNAGTNGDGVKYPKKMRVDPETMQVWRV